jgi:hypothetical protein
MVKKPTPAPTAEDNQKAAAADANASGPVTPATAEDNQKTAAAEANASGPVTPATGNEGEAKAAEAGAEGPAAGAGQIDQAEQPSITVFGPAKGRWRAGRFFGPEATIVLLSDISDDQLLALHGDPELVVTGVN